MSPISVIASFKVSHFFDINSASTSESEFLSDVGCGSRPMRPRTYSSSSEFSNLKELEIAGAEDEELEDEELEDEELEDEALEDEELEDNELENNELEDKELLEL